MQFRNTIDLERSKDLNANDRPLKSPDTNRRAHSQVCHPYLLAMTLLYERHSRQPTDIPRELAFDRLEECPVKVIDDLKMSGQKLLK